MSSILTNTSATTALRTLQAINANIVSTQLELATGRRVASSEDSSAIWSISKAMQTDVAGFDRLSNNIALGQSTISVARQAAETVTTLLSEMKVQVVTAQQDSVDRAKIQSEVSNLRDQIEAVVAMAQFNGLNLLNNTDSTAGTGTVSVLSSLDRSGATVTARDIDVRKRDLGTRAGSIAATGGTFTASAASVTLNAMQTATLDASALAVAAGTGFALSVFGTDADGSAFAQASYRTTTGATPTQAEVAAASLSYVARDGDTMGDVVTAIGRKWTAFAQQNDLDPDVLTLGFASGRITATSGVTDGTDQIALTFSRVGADAGNTIGGGLDMLSGLDVSTKAGAVSALARMDGLIATAIGSAAAFGSDQTRLEIQGRFVKTLADTMRSGIGTMVDADLEEASARLQALQVQQQLAVQAMSIANNSPRVLLGLFR